MHIPLIIIGGGLSGLAAGIRFARFNPNVLILEQHSRIGGLNSYYYRNNTLLETGLHAITNFAPANDKKAPLNRLLRQLKLKRKDFVFHEQIQSEILFTDQESLLFSNDFSQFSEEIFSKFPHCSNGFKKLVTSINEYNPFIPTTFKSARKFILTHLNDELLADMILCPLMFYGSSVENDMDLGQFAIMFRAIFQEGMFRPETNIKDFLNLLRNHYEQFGGKINLKSKVKQIITNGKKANAVELVNGEIIECDHIISTIGYEETLKLTSKAVKKPIGNRLGFVESIFQLPVLAANNIPKDKTIIFYNNSKKLSYQQPHNIVDFNSGVVCFPQNFQHCTVQNHLEVRATHLSNYNQWKAIATNRKNYLLEKQNIANFSKAQIEKIIGNFKENIVYEDTFTPLTIEHFTAKKEGAIYGSPTKIKDGNIGFDNLFIAGTDQGFLGIIGSMLSGISITNQHILSKL